MTTASRPVQFLAFMTAFGQFMAAALTMGQAFVGIVSVVPAVRASFSDSARPAGGQGHSNVPRRAEGRGAGAAISCSGMSRMGRLSFGTCLFIFDRESTPRSSGRPGAASPPYSACCWDSRPRCRGRSSYDGADLAGLDAQACHAGRLAWSCSRARCSPAASWPNISGAASLPVEEVWQAARMAGMEEDIKKHADGPAHRWFRLAAAELSGGQRQRILIARARRFKTARPLLR